jgi:hypothetical protein
MTFFCPAGARSDANPDAVKQEVLSLTSAEALLADLHIPSLAGGFLILNPIQPKLAVSIGL